MSQPLMPSSDDKLFAGLSYAGLALFGIPSVIIYLQKRDESDFIKFHSLQAIAFVLLCIVLSIGMGVLAMVPIVNIVVFLASFFIWLLPFGYWIYLMWQSFTGNNPRIPMVADFIDQNFMH